MGRNYFSKHGGPYFINDGLSRHSDNKSATPDKSLFYIQVGLAFFLTLPLAGLLLLYIL